jgi:hypothetical protein
MFIKYQFTFSTKYYDVYKFVTAFIMASHVKKLTITLSLLVIFKHFSECKIAERAVSYIEKVKLFLNGNLK